MLGMDISGVNEKSYDMTSNLHEWVVVSSSEDKCSGQAANTEVYLYGSYKLLCPVLHMWFLSLRHSHYNELLLLRELKLRV